MADVTVVGEFVLDTPDEDFDWSVLELDEAEQLERMERLSQNAESLSGLSVLLLVDDVDEVDDCCGPAEPVEVGLELPPGLDALAEEASELDLECFLDACCGVVAAGSTAEPLTDWDVSSSSNCDSRTLSSPRMASSSSS